MAESLTPAGKKRIKRYIRDQLSKGHHISELKNHLITYGHPEREVELLFEEILEKDEQKKRRAVQRVFEILFVVLFFVFVVWVSVTSQAPGEAIFIGFLPTIVYIVITAVIIDYKDKHASLLVSLPVGLNFLFYIAGSIGTAPFLADMEVGKLAILNIIISYIFLLAIYYSEIFEGMDLSDFFDQEERIPKKQQTFTQVYQQAAGIPMMLQEKKQESSEAVETIEITPRKKEGYLTINDPQAEPLQKTIHSIEDKLKALNAVIGRVYRRANGGNTLIRDLIKIKPEWYNEFNDLAKTEDKEKILLVLNKIEKRLNRLFRSEKEIFGTKSFRNLKREGEGKSRIIDVLIKNDRDPVESYFENALIGCGRIRERLDKLL